MAGRLCCAYMTMDNLDYRLGEIAGKLDQLLASVAAKDLVEAERDKQMERRVSVLEAARWKTAGALSVWSLILSIALAWFENARR